MQYVTTAVSQDILCNLSTSISLPTNLQLYGCHVIDKYSTLPQVTNYFPPNIVTDTSASEGSSVTVEGTDVGISGFKLSDMLNKSPEKSQKDLAAMIRPRKLKLDKTLTKYKMHKSLPVSPVNEERMLSDFVEDIAANNSNDMRKSFSYFIDFHKEIDTDTGLKQICDDIEKFSKDFNKSYADIEHIFDEAHLNKKYEVLQNEFKKIQLIEKNDKNEDDDETNFSSDSLEECSFTSTRNKKLKHEVPPRRCVSNNEIYKYQSEDIDYSKFYHAYDCNVIKSSSFYLNQSNKNSQESVLSEDNLDYDLQRSRSYCNSLESVLSNESDCKSAPLEILFSSQRRCETDAEHTKSLPKKTSRESYDCKNNVSKNYEEFSQLKLYSNLYLNPYSTVSGSDLRRSQTFTGIENRPQKNNLRTSQTQTEMNFRTPEEIVATKSNLSTDFQQKLLKFETCIAQNNLKTSVQTTKQSNKKGIAFFVKADQSVKPPEVTMKKNSSASENIESVAAKNYNVKTMKEGVMYIPTLESKNKQYKSKFCNVLNNKPEFNIEIYENGNKNKKTFALTNLNFEGTNRNRHIQETSSLDRHLLSKGLIDGQKICHKPPKAVRRHSSKTRKNRTYEYIRKDNFFDDVRRYNVHLKKELLNNCSDENVAPSPEKTIEIHYKEKNMEKECENGANLFTELYDSLDKTILNTKMEYDSLEINMNNEEKDFKMLDSLEVVDVKNWSKDHQSDEHNVWKNENTVDKLKSHNCELNLLNRTGNPPAMDRIHLALENIKILHEIQKKIHKINNLVEIFTRNQSVGKVKALSSMYESLTNSKSYHNNISKTQLHNVKYRKRNLSLPNFVERRLNKEIRDDVENKNVFRLSRNELHLRQKIEEKCINIGKNLKLSNCKNYNNDRSNTFTGTVNRENLPHSEQQGD